MPAVRAAIALRVVTGVLVLVILFQAILAGQFLYGGRPGAVDVHRVDGIVAASVQTLLVILAALAHWVWRCRNSGRLLAFAACTLPLFSLQIALGFQGGAAGRPGALAIHIPLGVLLMGPTTCAFALAWSAGMSEPDP